jgi:hypothetical protein
MQEKLTYLFAKEADELVLDYSFMLNRGRKLGHA